ncbi:patatin-like phospholipase family protein [Acidithiobacillus caldus]
MSPHLLPDPQYSSVRQTAPSAFPRGGIALVLGVGGARGLAHMGVLQALDELRIPVRAVVGASIGALRHGADPVWTESGG